MENRLQEILDIIFKVNKENKNFKYLKNRGFDNINALVLEVGKIKEKESNLSAKNRAFISNIFLNLYHIFDVQKEMQEKKANELDNSSEGSEGEVIKVK